MKNKELISTFWSTLFDPEEHTCIASNVKGNQVVPVSVSGNPEHPDYESMQYFSINAHVPGTTRAGSNVVTYRNFLVEFDKDASGNKLSKEEQARAVKASGLPWSTCVWSGSKSFHFIVSLETPLKTKQEYAYVSDWIHKIISLSDQSTIDVSRFSRVPGGTNVDKTSEACLPPAEQVLYAVKGRIPNEVFERWLFSHPEHEPKAEEIVCHGREFGRIRKSSRIWTEEEAEKHCNEKWPLEAGQKQNGLASWATFLVGNTNLKREEIAKFIARNDMERNRRVSEYERAVDRVLAMEVD